MGMAEEKAGRPSLDSTASQPGKFVQAMFDCFVRVQLGDETAAQFWTDACLPDGHIQSIVPHLYMAVGKRYLKTSVKDALLQNKWV
jgi:hypothetical protein